MPNCGANSSSEVAARNLLESKISNGGNTSVPLEPLSDACKQFPYTRYFRVNTYEDFKKFGQVAIPGDMVELIPGIYYLGDGQLNEPDPSEGYGQDDTGPPVVATSGTINGLVGTPQKPIIFCGSQDGTIIDGADSIKYAFNAIRILKSQYVHVSGFTTQNVMKGIDVQGSKDCEISFINTRNTLQEGIRIRYNSVRNTVRNCTIKDTGLMYVGVGEGVYIGSSHKNSIDYGLPTDKSDYNVIRDNKFGPGVTAEAVDIKEFTSYGKVINNDFDGTNLSGENGAISWVAVKGNSWTIQGNRGKNLKKSNFVGIKVVVMAKGWGSQNSIKENRCDLGQGGSLCVFIATGTLGNKISCSNVVGPLYKQAPAVEKSSPKLCNCKTRCLKRSGRSATLGTTPVLRSYYNADSLFNVEEEAARPSWD